ncbi:IS110 family transposase [Nocardioides sp. MAHUQ-72]|uniref:IS110 family transposase n=1 Tax=unclassified Nocardioides TaxID=2615069 RepID=UPI0036227F3E
MQEQAERIVIGMDPHKRSATIEVMTADETIVGGGRFATDREGYAEMRRYAAQWRERVWAIEGCAGIGKHIAVRLLADDEEIVDMPPNLSARARVFATGQGRKTDATDAHSVALVGTRTSGLGRWSTTSSSRCCGAWSTVAAHWVRSTPARALSCTSCSSS